MGIDFFKFEIETFDKLFGFNLNSNYSASGGAMVEASQAEWAEASSVLDIGSGTFDISINFFDENDGVSTSTLSINDLEIGTWDWDAQSDTNFANDTSLTSVTFENVDIMSGSTFSLAGLADGGEPLRIDSIELRRVEPEVEVAEPAQPASIEVAPEPALAEPINEVEVPVLEAAAAFDGAQGFGAVTQGGRGGEIVKVTTLADSGEGSLRWALEELDGPRIVVFDVEGTIDLTDQIEINGEVTVAGQTAPGEGITITGARLRVVESDVIIRGLHIRPGDGEGSEADDRDAISIGKEGSEVARVIIDSNSFSWATDEVVSTWGGPSDVTISNNIIAEALESSIHSEGDHSMGMLIGDGSQNITVVGNLFVSNQHRNPQLIDAQGVEFINNVVYNYGDNGFQANGRETGSTAHLIGNVFVAGPDSNREPIRLNTDIGDSAYYLTDNIGATGGAAQDAIQDGFAFEPSGVIALPSGEVLEAVLATVGARNGDGELDAVDARILGDVVNDTGEIKDTMTDETVAHASVDAAEILDTDGDGIRDEFEALVGGDKFVFDAHEDSDGDGFTNIEEYLNGLIDGFETEQGSGKSSVEVVLAPMRYEVEDLDDLVNSEVQLIDAASGGKALQAASAGASSIGLPSVTEDGIYEVSVDAFDENDGASTLSLEINGVIVESFTLDNDFGDYLASEHTLTTIDFAAVEVLKGDTIRLVTMQDGKEPARIDAVELMRTGDIPPLESWQIEMEDVFVFENMRLETIAGASGGAVLRDNGSGLSKAEFAFGGEEGVFDILIDHFDENDGASTLRVVVNDTEIGAWVWDHDEGGYLADANSLTTMRFEQISMSEGDTVRLIGESDLGEPLRIDMVTFVPSEVDFV